MKTISNWSKNTPATLIRNIKKEEERLKKIEKEKIIFNSYTIFEYIGEIYNGETSFHKFHEFINETAYKIISKKDKTISQKNKEIQQLKAEIETLKTLIEIL
jgi:hypothetical protein